MKKNILFLVICMIIAHCGYSQKNTVGNYRGYVKYGEASAPGTVNVISTGFAKKKAESIKDAYKAAFYAILFRGIPGSPYELPMVPDESEKKNHPVIVALLNQGYISFVTETVLQSEDKKVKGEDGVKGIMTTHKITINCDALRRHLEQNNVIRKFGV